MHRAATIVFVLFYVISLASGSSSFEEPIKVYACKDNILAAIKLRWNGIFPGQIQYGLYGVVATTQKVPPGFCFQEEFGPRKSNKGNTLTTSTTAAPTSSKTPFQNKVVQGVYKSSLNGMIVDNYVIQNSNNILATYSCAKASKDIGAAGQVEIAWSQVDNSSLYDVQAKTLVQYMIGIGIPLVYTTRCTSKSQ